MQDLPNDGASTLAAQMEGGAFYRVAFLGILNPDRGGLEGSPARKASACPFQKQDVLLPLPVATAIETLGSHIAIVVGEESTAEHLGYVAYVSAAEALQAATSIAFYAEAALRDIEMGGYVHFEIEVCVCPWETFGNQPTFNDASRLQLITVAQPQAGAAERVC